MLKKISQSESYLLINKKRGFVPLNKITKPNNDTKE